MKKIISMVALSFLTQCSVYQEEFDCPYGKGVGCKSTEAVDKMIDQGSFAEEGDVSDSMDNDDEKNQDSRPAQIQSGSLQGKQIIREPEKTLEVWLAPFQDKSGNLYQETTIHTVVKPGYWKEVK